jgi:thiol-disulfide isomerase/thioredoxin
MVSISLGPIALPVAPLLLLAALWAAAWTATRLWRREPGNAARAEGADPAGQTVVVAALIGLLVARLVHLASHAAPYLASPMSMLDLRDGGWHAGSGAAAGVAWLAWRGWRMPGSRRPLAIASLTGAVVWVAGVLLTGHNRAAPMPSTALARLDGGQAVTLASAAAGRPAVVNLWASWCGPCRQEMPTLAAAQQRGAGIAFLFVNQGEPETTIRSHLASQGLPLREVLLDRSSQLGPAVGSRGLPTTLFYDAAGSLVDAHFGVLNAAALESRLQALRARR